MRVAQGGLNTFVAHEHLNSPEWHPCHDETRSKGMPKVVPAEIGFLPLSALY